MLKRLLMGVAGVMAAVSLSAQVTPAGPKTGASYVAGLLYASNFGQWQVPKGNLGQYSWSNPSYCQPTVGAFSPALTINAFTVGTPVEIIDTDNAANDEQVTPYAVSILPTSCSISIAPTKGHDHFYFASATAGLQEALNWALGTGSVYEVVLTPDWPLAGGTTGMITSATGSSSVSVSDQRTSVLNAYTWNGSAYVVTLPVQNGVSLTPSQNQIITGYFLSAPYFGDASHTQNFTFDVAFGDSWSYNQGGWCNGIWGPTGNCWQNDLIADEAFSYGQTIAAGGNTFGAQAVKYFTTATSGVITAMTWKPHSIVGAGLGINDAFGAGAYYIQLVNNPVNGDTVTIQAPSQGSGTAVTFCPASGGTGSCSSTCTAPGSGNTVCIDSRGSFYTAANFISLLCSAQTFQVSGPTPPGVQEVCTGLSDPNLAAFVYDGNDPNIGVIRVVPVSLGAIPTLTTNDATNIAFQSNTLALAGSQAAAAADIQQAHYTQTGAALIELTAPLPSQADGGVVSHVYAQTINTASGCTGGTPATVFSATGFAMLLTAGQSCTYTLQGSAFYALVEVGTGLAGTYTLCATPATGTAYCAPTTFSTGIVAYGPNYVAMGYGAVRPPNTNGPAAVTLTVTNGSVVLISFASNGAWDGSWNTRYLAWMEEGNFPYGQPWISNAERAGQRQAISELTSLDGAPAIDIGGIATVFDCYSSSYGCGSAGPSPGGYFHPILGNAPAFANIWSGFLSSVISPDKAQGVRNGAYLGNASTGGVGNATQINGAAVPVNASTLGSNVAGQLQVGPLATGVYDGNYVTCSQLQSSSTCTGGTNWTYSSATSDGGVLLNQGPDYYNGNTAAYLVKTAASGSTANASTYVAPTITVNPGSTWSMKAHVSAVVGALTDIGTISGTAPTGAVSSTVTLSAFTLNGTAVCGNAVATITLGTLNSWTGAAAGVGGITNVGPCTAVPNGATCTAGTATCPATVTLTGAAANQSASLSGYIALRASPAANCRASTSFLATATPSWTPQFICASVPLTLQSVSTTITGTTFGGTGNVLLSNFSNCTGATAFASIVSGVVANVTMTNNGTCSANPTTATCTSSTATCSGSPVTVNVSGTASAVLQPVLVNGNTAGGVLAFDDIQVWAGSAAQKGTPVISTTAAVPACLSNCGNVIGGVVQAVVPGTITAVNAGNGISGGGSSGAVTVSAASACKLTVPTFNTGSTSLNLTNTCTIAAGTLGANSALYLDAFVGTWGPLATVTAISSGGGLSGSGTVFLTNFGGCIGSTATVTLASGAYSSATVTAAGDCTGAPTTALCTSGTATCTGSPLNVTITSTYTANTGTCTPKVYWSSSSSASVLSGGTLIPGTAITAAHPVEINGSVSNSNSVSMQQLDGKQYGTTSPGFSTPTTAYINTANASYLLFYMQNSVSGDVCAWDQYTVKASN